MSERQQERIISLQRQVKVARDALLRIREGTRDPERVAAEAMDTMWGDDITQALQGLVGHGAPTR
jgi:hypothetical protein